MDLLMDDNEDKPSGQPSANLSNGRTYHIPFILMGSVEKGPTPKKCQSSQTDSVFIRQKMPLTEHRHITNDKMSNVTVKHLGSSQTESKSMFLAPKEDSGSNTNNDTGCYSVTNTRKKDYAKSKSSGMCHMPNVSMENIDTSQTKSENKIVAVKEDRGPNIADTDSDGNDFECSDRSIEESSTTSQNISENFSSSDCENINKEKQYSEDSINVVPICPRLTNGNCRLSNCNPCKLNNNMKRAPSIQQAGSPSMAEVTDKGTSLSPDCISNAIELPGSSLLVSHSGGVTLTVKDENDSIVMPHDTSSSRIHTIQMKSPNHLEPSIELNVCIDDSQFVEIDGQKRWKCNMCNKSYTTKTNLITHILDHNGIKPYSCQTCGKFFKQVSHLHTHELTHENRRPHKCDQCDKAFIQVSHLRRHEATHMSTKPHICDICNRGFAYPSELKIHKDRHTKHAIKGESKRRTRKIVSEEDLVCRFCHRKYAYPSQLRDHIKIHQGDRPYMCTLCGMVFMKEHHLKSHQFTHTGLKPFKCDICEKGFNQKANMTRHMFTHKNTREFKCEICGKDFIQPQTLKAHMIVHSNSKPYSCVVCGKAFSRLHNLHGHMHLHEETKPYTCHCGASFTLKGNFARHQRERHVTRIKVESDTGEPTLTPEDGDYVSYDDDSPRKKKRKSHPQKSRVVDTDGESDYNPSEDWTVYESETGSVQDYYSST